MTEHGDFYDAVGQYILVSLHEKMIHIKWYSYESFCVDGLPAVPVNVVILCYFYHTIWMQSSKRQTKEKKGAERSRFFFQINCPQAEMSNPRDKHTKSGLMATVTVVMGSAWCHHHQHHTHTHKWTHSLKQVKAIQMLQHESKSDRKSKQTKRWDATQRRGSALPLSNSHVKRK